jgi:hypothetical protein
MARESKHASSIFRELKRRRVGKTCLYYVLLCWGMLEVGDILFPTLEVDAEQASQILLYTAVAGLPLIAAFAWFFQITPSGVVRTIAFIDRRVLNNVPPLNDQRHEGVNSYFRDEEDDFSHHWVVIAESGPLAGLSYGLSLPLILGRSQDCDITLPSAHVSRHHARLYVESNLLMIEDLGSSNGSIINGKQLEGTQALHHQDELVFHDTVFRVAENLALADGKALSQATYIKPGNEI